MLEKLSTIKNERLLENLRKIVGGREDLIFHAFHLNNMKHAEPIAAYMVKQNLVGNNLAELLNKKYNHSFFNMVSDVIAQINKTRAKGVYAGKDYGRNRA